MTNEQREAIEDFKKEYEQCNYTQSDLIIELDYAKEILSLIKGQQEKIEKYEKIYKEYDCYRWVKELDKKDKQIDLMAEKMTLSRPMICRTTKGKEFCVGRIYMSKDEIKEYFERICEDE